MVTNIAFFVPGEPQGKGRARSTSTGRHYTPAKTVAYEGLVAMAAKHAMGPASPFAGPLAVEIDATLTVPASWSKKRRSDALAGLVHPGKKPDWDNVGKAISDGGNGVAWVDDAQIVRAVVVKRYGLTPGVHVRVATLEAEQ